MERRKPKGSIDEFAIIKAAAWAWYERGSGFEGRSMREYDATRTTRVRKPSRYKLEAMRRAQDEETGLSQRSSTRAMLISPCLHTDNLLLDRYEIERISKELDYYVDESSNTYGSGGSIEDYRRGGGSRRVFSWLEGITSGLNGGTKKNKKKNGFWVLGNGIACGSRDDVVENIGVHRRRRPERNGQLAAAANHRGQAAHA